MTGVLDQLADSFWLRAPLGLVAGAVAGGIASTLLIRWPDRRRGLIGRSRCDTCGRSLGVGETVPIVAFLALGGRCLTCRAPIEPRHIALELAAAALGMLALALQPGWTGVASAVFGWWLLLLAALDVDGRLLPHRVTLPLIAAGLALAFVAIGPPQIDRAIGAAAGFAAPWLVLVLGRRFRRRQPFYAGIPELGAAAGAWLGWMLFGASLLAAALLGLLLWGVQRTRGGKGAPASSLPLGALLAVAAWCVWFVVTAA